MKTHTATRSAHHGATICHIEVCDKNRHAKPPHAQTRRISTADSVEAADVRLDLQDRDRGRAELSRLHAAELRE